MLPMCAMLVACSLLFSVPGFDTSPRDLADRHILSASLLSPGRTLPVSDGLQHLLDSLSEGTPRTLDSEGTGTPQPGPDK